MSIEDNLRAVRSEGSSCIVCGGAIPTGCPVVQLEVEVDLLLTSKKIRKEIHNDPCAKKLRGVLDLRIAQASRMQA